MTNGALSIQKGSSMRLDFAFVTFLCFFTGTLDAQTVDRKWLNEDAWPAFAHHRPVAIGENEDELPRIQKERFNACLDEFRNRYVYWLQGVGTLASVCENADRLVTSRIDIGTSRAENLKLHEEKLVFAKRILEQAEVIRMAKNTTVSHIDEKFARYYRLDAEVTLLQLKKPLDADGRGR
jgi:hypothetical protein